MMTGSQMIELAHRLWPICRSISGPGVRETLKLLGRELSGLVVNEVPTGTRCFDWEVPREWSIISARIVGPDGETIVDFADHNLHVVSYSVPVDARMSLSELDTHLHSLPDQPDAIPYVTTYYAENWGFCLPHSLRTRLREGTYDVKIDSELSQGSMTYGELVIPGRSDREVLVSTYICHPSMANNELSGPCVSTAMAKFVQQSQRNLTYRFLFLPETIGAIYYLSRHLRELKQRVVAGYVLTCVGDERDWSFMPSRSGKTLADAVARHVLQHAVPQYKEYSFLQRGSDERQYCSPGIDLPVASIMRSKYATYPEYHTSLDNFSVVTADGLSQSLDIHVKAIETLESLCVPVALNLGEPMMSKRGLRSSLGFRGSADQGKVMMDLLAYSDGTCSILSIAEILGVPVWELMPIVEALVGENLLRVEPIPELLTMPAGD